MTSPVDTSVKYFHSAMPGAPVLSGTAGALIAILDACLVNGFGLKTVDSLVVSNNVATLTIASGHSAEIGSVILVAGATPAALNGEQKITAVTGTSASFATSDITNQTATGTISMKIAPVGWAKAFSGTNLAAYKPSDPTATGALLRVDDTGTKTARVVGYETMTDINTGTGPFPTAAQRTGGSYWTKSNAADATARGWMIAADSKFIYFAREFYSTSYPGTYELTVFGDSIPTKSGDPFCAQISGAASDRSGSAPGNYAENYSGGDGGTAAEVYMPRAYTGLGTAAQMIKSFPTVASDNTSTRYSGAVTGGMPFPNRPDGGLYLVPHYLSEYVGKDVRAISPGYYCCPQNVPVGQFASRDYVTGIVSLPGKTLRAVLSYDNSHSAVSFFDITGPWR